MDEVRAAKVEKAKVKPNNIAFLDEAAVLNIIG